MQFRIVLGNLLKWKKKRNLCMQIYCCLLLSYYPEKWAHGGFERAQCCWQSFAAGWHILYMLFEILISNGYRGWETEKPWGWSLSLSHRRGTVEVLAVQISPFCLWCFVTHTKIFLYRSELIFSICTQVFSISTKLSSFLLATQGFGCSSSMICALTILWQLGHEIFITFVGVFWGVF